MTVYKLRKVLYFSLVFFLILYFIALAISRIHLHTKNVDELSAVGVVIVQKTYRKTRNNNRGGSRTYVTGFIYPVANTYLVSNNSRQKPYSDKDIIKKSIREMKKGRVSRVIIKKTEEQLSNLNQDSNDRKYIFGGYRSSRTHELLNVSDTVPIYYRSNNPWSVSLDFDVDRRYLAHAARRSKNAAIFIFILLVVLRIYSVVKSKIIGNLN